MKLLLGCISIVVMSMTGGCYTQFARFEPRAIPPEHVVTLIDSSGKEIRVVKRTDTIRSAQGETCIWEQDLMGFPYLHCYPAYYPPQWYLYNYSPWWYKNNTHMYDADRCPPYYYYDNNCGCCRYYLNRPERMTKSTRTSSAWVPVSDTSGKVAAVKGDSDRVSISTSSSFTKRIPVPLPSPHASAPVQGITRVAPGGAAPKAVDTGAHKQPPDSVSTGTGTAVPPVDTAHVVTDSVPRRPVLQHSDSMEIIRQRAARRTMRSR